MTGASRKSMWKIWVVTAVAVIIGLTIGIVLAHDEPHTTTDTQHSGNSATQPNTTSSNNTSSQSSGSIGSMSGTKLSVTPSRATTVSNGQSGKATIQVLNAYDGVHSGATPQTGFKYDALLVKLTNENTKGNAVPASDLVQGMFVIGSDGKAYYTSGTIDGCPDFSTANAEVGQPLEGCLTFMLPTNVTPTTASINFMNAGTEISWTITQ